MAILEHPAPRLPEQEGVRIAHELYGLSAAARTLAGEYDDNFHLVAQGGEEFTLKVMRSGLHSDFIDLQCQALARVAERAPSLLLPRVCKTLGGETIGRVQAADSTKRYVWMLTYVPGRLLADTRPRTAELQFSLGRFMGIIDGALADFVHPAARRELKWDLARAGWIRDYLHSIPGTARRNLVSRLMKMYDTEVAPALPALRQSVIHNDANDYNVLVSESRVEPREVVSVIDFGDMLHTNTVGEVAVAAAYALLGEPDPLAAAAQVVAGYHSVFPLEEKEIALLYPLICARLCVSVTNSAYRKTLEPDDPYVTISEQPAWDALQRLAALHPRFAHYTFRHACGLPPVPRSEPVVTWLRAHADDFASVVRDLRKSPSIVFDLSVGSLLLGADPRAAETAALTDTLFGQMGEKGVQVGIGRYDEARPIYPGPAFATGEHPTDKRRTVHLGIDLFVAPGSPIYAPLDGAVHCLANNTADKDYGPLVILQHATDGGHKFYTLYGHLSEDSLAGLALGQSVARGERLASVGAPPTNGNWPPHLHFQLIIDLLDLDRNFPGVVLASQRGVWRSLCPDPNVILGIPADLFAPPGPTTAETLAARRERTGRNLSITYREPLKIVRGWMQYLYDETGRAYLDAYNNVPHVGHSHPKVVQAARTSRCLFLCELG
jgi:Ser/Thr protein kinase RdoA (MazF antagonist)